MFIMLQSAHTQATSNCSATSTVSFVSTQRQLTVMLVTICCAAVCLQSPYTIIYILNTDKASLWPGQHVHMTLRAKIYLSLRIADMLATSNYAVNFALYCVSGSAFRHSVRRICQGSRGLQRHGGRYEAAAGNRTHISNKSVRANP